MMDCNMLRAGSLSCSRRSQLPHGLGGTCVQAAKVARAAAADVSLLPMAPGHDRTVALAAARLPSWGSDDVLRRRLPWYASEQPADHLHA